MACELLAQVPGLGVERLKDLVGLTPWLNEAMSSVEVKLIALLTDAFRHRRGRSAVVRWPLDAVSEEPGHAQSSAARSGEHA
jgi:hypothetical protein